MNVQKVKLADIDRRLADRIRPVSVDAAHVMRTSIEDLGLMSPIEVRRNKTKGADHPFILVSGAVRLAVADLLAWDTIDAAIVDIDSAAARVREIDENLYRHDLTVLARAQCLAERKKIYDAERGETRGGDRKSAAIKLVKNTILIDGQANAPEKRFTLAVADRMGVSESSVRKWIALYNALQPRVVALLSETSIADDASELRFISTLTGAVEQLEVVETALARGILPSALMAERVQAPGEVDREQFWVSLGKKEAARILKMDKAAVRALLDELVRAGVIDARQIAGLAA
ncbi:ParB/RepB/Spo0J family partition protein [Asaia bogorensis]|uniref:ParB/RepB/Spo0J family partition protein n=1 Tax=Asaia bogorensis TaxID=91915 RepID=UPI003015D2C3